MTTPSRHRADALLGDELHRDRRRGVHLLQVEHELREVLDRVDVVVRRGADQRDGRLGVPEPGDLGASPCAPGAGHPRPAWTPARS